MTVRRIPPIDRKTSDEPATVNPEPSMLLEDYLSFDEALWRAELRQAKQHAEAFGALRDVTQCVLKIVPMLTVKQGANSLKLSKHLKNLERAAASIGKLDPSNLTLEMERRLFIASLAAARFEYHSDDNIYDHLGIQVFVDLPARRVAAHYWTYEQGSVLNSKLDMDIELSFIDPAGEVQKLMTAEKLTARQARTKIMDRAVHAVRLSPASDEVAAQASMLTQLKIADPTRFKNVTKLGVIPPPPSDDDTSDDDTADEEA